MIEFFDLLFLVGVPSLLSFSFSFSFVTFAVHSTLGFVRFLLLPNSSAVFFFRAAEMDIFTRSFLILQNIILASLSGHLWRNSWTPFVLSMMLVFVFHFLTSALALAKTRAWYMRFFVP